MPLSGLDPELSLDGVCVNPGSSADEGTLAPGSAQCPYYFLGARWVRAVGGPERVRY